MFLLELHSVSQGSVLDWMLESLLLKQEMWKSVSE